MRWSHETVALEAKKYETKQAFRSHSYGGYQWAKRKGLLPEICSHMVGGKAINWTDATCQAEALKYETRKAFELGSTAYQYASKNSLLDMVCSHMPMQIQNWTKELCQAEALKYETRNDFKDSIGGAYNYARNTGIINEVCSHMVAGGSCDGDMVYLWKIPNTNIYKIGVSSVRLGDTRINDVAKELDKGCEIIGMYEVSNAFEIEAELHSTYQIEPTTLPKVDGHTEFRILGESDVNEITYYLENVVGKRV